VYTQIAGFLYERPDPKYLLFEVHLLVIPPQADGFDNISFPPYFPENKYFEGLTPIGWIHTTPLEDSYLNPQDTITTASLLQDRDDFFSIIIISYPPDGCSIRGFTLLSEGLEWGKQNIGTKDRPIDYLDTFYINIPILLSESYGGWFMIPKGVEWNLNFIRTKLSKIHEYEVEVGNPSQFYDQSFRPNHFLRFIQEATPFSIDAEDPFLKTHFLLFRTFSNNKQNSASETP
jgi:pre-mRNA-processing factor 8